jgi:four helix bundle protein
MRDFRKLIVWQRAHGLALDTHRVLAGAHGRGASATRNQLNRAMASIPANLAEGCGKRSDAEFARYVDIALGSAKEAENHLIFACDMAWIDATSYSVLDARLTDVRRMLFALGNAIRARELHGMRSNSGRELTAGREPGVGGHEGEV